ncbi:MAG: tetratricopeptide repeat protein, partial [Rhodospirillaceae bacterium]
FITEATPGGLIYRKDLYGHRRRPVPVTAPTASEPVEYLASGLEPAIATEDPGSPLPPAKSLAAEAQDAFETLRGLADTGDTAKALAFAVTAAAAHPASPEIGFLHAVLLMNIGRLADAENILKRLVYLDPALAVAHFALGNLRTRMNDRNGAARAFRAAYKAAAARPSAEVPVLSEGDTAGQIAAAAAAHAGGFESAPLSRRRAGR